MAKFTISGLDDIEKKLKKMQKAAKELDGTHSISFNDLFSDKFMRENTSFSSINAFFEAGGFEINSQEDFENLSEDVLNAHIAATTDFSDWEEMKSAAGAAYAAKKLGF